MGCNLIWWSERRSASVEAICNKPVRSAGQKTQFSGCLQVPCGCTEGDEWESVLTATVGI